MMAQIAYHNHDYCNHCHQNRDSQASRRDGSDCQGHPGDKKGQLSHVNITSKIEKYIANILLIYGYGYIYADMVIGYMVIHGDRFTRPSCDTPPGATSWCQR